MDKRYQFNLTERQVELINELIEGSFELSMDMDAVPNNGIELMSLAAGLNFELGFNQGYEKSLEVEE